MSPPVSRAPSVPRAGTLANKTPPSPHPSPSRGGREVASGVWVPARSSQTKELPIVGLRTGTGTLPAPDARRGANPALPRPAPLPRSPCKRLLSKRARHPGSGGWASRVPVQKESTSRATLKRPGSWRAIPRTPRPRRFQRHHLRRRSSARQPPT